LININAVSGTKEVGHMQVKGMAFIARLDFIKTHFGEEKAEEVLATIPQVRALLSSSGNFYPSRLHEYDHYIAFNQAACDVLYKGNEKAFIEMGKESAEGALRSVHKVFVMNRDVRSFLRSLPVIFNAYYVDMGAATVEIDDKMNSAATSMHMPRNPHRSVCQVLRGYIHHGMELCGATGIELNETSCMCRGEETCKFEIRWD
jgi:predicted hydrocarbon binding protein